MDGGAAYDELDELYDLWCAEVEEDIPFYLMLADAVASERGRQHANIVELGAGSGRLTIPLLAAGHQVTALDASARQLDRLDTRARDREASARLHVLHADMRDVAAVVARGSADLVIAPFRSLLHVTQHRHELFGAIHEVLATGGVFAFDVFHTSPDRRSFDDRRWMHRRSEHTEQGTWRFDERASHRPAAAGEPPDETLLEVEVRCRFRAKGRRRSSIERSTRLALRLAPPSAWRDTLIDASFEVDGAYGWFDARPLTDQDDDSIWVARRRA